MVVSNAKQAENIITNVHDSSPAVTFNETLNKDRINILKLNIPDVLDRFKPRWDTKTFEFFQIISWQMTKMWWRALKLKTDKQDLRFTTLLILFREENEKWSDDLYGSAFAFFVWWYKLETATEISKIFMILIPPLGFLLKRPPWCFNLSSRENSFLNKLLSKTDRQRLYITYVTKWSA